VTALNYRETKLSSLFTSFYTSYFLKTCRKREFRAWEPLLYSALTECCITSIGICYVLMWIYYKYISNKKLDTKTKKVLFVRSRA